MGRMVEMMRENLDRIRRGDEPIGAISEAAE
jgi:hypothetical protein